MREKEPMPRIVRQLRSGQITIPAEFRKKLGIGEESLLQLTLAEGELRIRPVELTQKIGGSPWFKELYDVFAPVRQEAAALSEQEINASIDQAVSAVREKHDRRRL